MTERIVGITAVADRLGCGRETARKLMHEMPLVVISPKGTKRPRMGVKESDLERWITGRMMTMQSEPQKRTRKVTCGDWPKLEYRKK